MMKAGSIFQEKGVIIASERNNDSCMLTFSCESIAPVIKPGQFVSILPPSPFRECVPPVRPIDVAEGLIPLYNPADVTILRRPFSMFRVTENGEGPFERASITILFRIIGKGTRLIAGMAPGQPLDVMGPLGHPFPLPPSTGQRVFLIAGGFGIAPLMPLARLLVQRGNPVMFLWGVTEASHAPVPVLPNSGAFQSVSGLSVGELTTLGVPSLVAADTNDGSSFRGTVCELFMKLVETEGPEHCRVPLVYTCGPEIMMRKIAEYCQNRNWQCRVSLEKFMACGLGACMSCVCNIKKTAEEHYYSRTCTEGPSFWGDTVVWEK